MILNLPHFYSPNNPKECSHFHKHLMNKSKISQNVLYSFNLTIKTRSFTLYIFNLFLFYFNSFKKENCCAYLIHLFHKPLVDCILMDISLLKIVLKKGGSRKCHSQQAFTANVNILKWCVPFLRSHVHICI